MDKRTTLNASLGLSLMTLACIGHANVVNNNITEAEVKSAQEAWGKALIQISQDHRTGGVAKAKARPRPFSMARTATTWARCCSSRRWQGGRRPSEPRVRVRWSTS